MKTFSIEIKNNRYVKVLGGGLPSFTGLERYESVEEAARAIYDGAYEIIDSEIAERIPEFDDDDDSEKFNAAWQAGMDAVLAEIVKYESWEHDGVQYRIVEHVLGTLHVCDKNGINCEPLNPNDAPYTRAEALDCDVDPEGEGIHLRETTGADGLDAKVDFVAVCAGEIRGYFRFIESEASE